MCVFSHFGGEKANPGNIQIIKHYLQEKGETYTVLGVPQQCDVFARLKEYEILTQTFVDNIAICYDPTHIRGEWRDVIC